MDTKILLVDDDARILRTFARTLKFAGYTVITADGGEKGMALFLQQNPDIVMLDLRMPGMNGLAALQAMRAHDPEANVILCTGHGEKDDVIDALRAGACDFLPKPVDQVTLETALRRAEERIHLKRELKASREELRQQNLQLEEQVKARTADLEREIEERKRTEEALRESETRERIRATDLKTILDTVPAVIWIAHDPEGRDITGNPASYQLLRMEQGNNTSLTPEEDQAPTHFKLFHDGVETPMEELPMQLACREGLSTMNHEGEIVFDDGTRRTIFGSTVPLRDENGQVRGAVAAYVDITERKQAEEALRESEHRLDQMLQTMVDGMVRVNVEGEITYANPAAEEILEVNRDTILNREYNDRIWRQVDQDGNDYPLENLPVALALAQKRAVEGIEHGVVTPSGQVKWLSVNAAPLLDENDQVYGALASFRDITERKRVKEALREAEERISQLEEALHAG